MSPLDIVVTILLLSWLSLAVFFIIRRRGKGCCSGCGGNCSACSGCTDEQKKNKK